MSPEKNHIGLVGLAVMGQNLVLNMAGHGHRVAVFNRTTEVTRRFIAERVRDRSIVAADSLQGLMDQLEKPRRVLLMVKAGPPVDAIIDQLRPFLETGDIVIDGGNSHFADTARREANLAAAGIRYLGVGISGGEEGALRGPSIMPGGSREAYAVVEPIFRSIAARAADGQPCLAYLGPAGAGHYAKMVHNGIEYAVMQMIAETYDLLHRGARMSVTQLHKVFAGWAKGELASYLIDVTVAVLGRQDERTGQPLVDCIVDAAEQKGTGRWTSQEAFELGVPIPSISAAVEARSLSALREVRAQASRSLVGADALGEGGGDLTEAAGAALYAGVVSAYAQGMELLRAGSLAHQYNLDLSEVARIWRAGCIIRASLLEDIRSAFVGSPAVSNLLLAEPFRTSLIRRQMPWRWVVQWAISSGVPVPALGSALAYYDSLRSERLPANLIQAQRDYFGAHTYRRLDQEGIFHTDWGD